VPDWATSLLASLLGGAIALSGVWFQANEQRRRELRAATALRTERFARMLSLLNEYSPDRVERLVLGRGQPITDAVMIQERLRPLRDELAIVAASEPGNARQILSLVERASAYLDSLPMIDHWEGDTPILRRTLNEADAQRLYGEIMALAEQLAR
jgi:hypothetical protein